MRWVWRAESGAFKLEYAGLVLLVAAVAAAVIGFGLPTQVSSGVESAVCTALDREDCEPGQGDGSSGEDPDGGQDSDGTDPGDGESPEGESPDGEEDGEGEETGSEGEEDGDGADTQSAVYDPELAQDLEDAQGELSDAEADQSAAEEEYGDLDEELLNLLSELIGLEDAKKCFLEGDIGACLMTLITALPWGKLLKVGSKIPKMWRLFDRWRSARRAKNAAEEAIEDARGKVDGALEACTLNLPDTPNSFTPATPVLLANGGHLSIEDVSAGDRVLATDPVTGVTGARPVTATITDTGWKSLVDVTVFSGGATATVTATDGHPFWDDAARQWTDAGELSSGDRLVTPDGSSLQVASVRSYTAYRSVHNLSVAGIHTYYVAVGGQNTLVHNKDKRNTDRCGRRTAPEQRRLATGLGYEPTGQTSHGQPVFKRSKKAPKSLPKFISGDVDVHNGGDFKGANSIDALGSKETRSGTYKIAYDESGKPKGLEWFKD
ncbi:Flp pilus assembly pilin Flp [Spinactinospora alkalitolerans]|uniref:Flp pilus assembly pilin Flp n=1 Tax=Spinactinospora alkalitolerans TaxID=687207 RepID=A0A852U0W0_9ACTN|nr:polymorphic toxin-type HINT domain-containing protein [Spinactinospora alkalitolerans]NYE49187.1 Flp pilus assembly pilin Flp [Spinactinospora alkalitolerans]